MALFLSTTLNKIDSKSRVSVPSNFRSTISEQSFNGIIAFPSYSNQCIDSCGIDRMEEIADNLDQNDGYSKEEFDLIIDDGLHTFNAGVTFFENSFSRLKKTGFYIIEDVHFAYLNKLAARLKDFEPQVIILNNKETQKDNNLILIRKT